MIDVGQGKEAVDAKIVAQLQLFCSIQQCGLTLLAASGDGGYANPLRTLQTEGKHIVLLRGPSLAYALQDICPVAEVVGLFMDDKINVQGNIMGKYTSTMSHGSALKSSLLPLIPMSAKKPPAKAKNSSIPKAKKEQCTRQQVSTGFTSSTGDADSDDYNSNGSCIFHGDDQLVSRTLSITASKTRAQAIEQGNIPSSSTSAKQGIGKRATAVSSSSFNSSDSSDDSSDNDDEESSDVTSGDSSEESSDESSDDESDEIPNLVKGLKKLSHTHTNTSKPATNPSADAIESYQLSKSQLKKQRRAAAAASSSLPFASSSHKKRSNSDGSRLRSIPVTGDKNAIRYISPRACHKEYLTTEGCSNPHCLFGHNYILSDEQTKYLRKLALEIPCPWLKIGNCPNGVQGHCIYG